MLYTLLTLVYIGVSIFLILVVLLQTGKRADLAGAFGGGGSQTAFGARGAANLLTKLTTAAAVLFMLTALSLAILTAQRATRSGSVLDEVEPSAESAPAAPLDPAATEPTPIDTPPPAEPVGEAAPADLIDAGGNPVGDPTED